MPTVKKLVVALIVVLGSSLSHNIEAKTNDRCGKINPNPTFSSSDLNNVLAALAKETTPAFSPSRYYPTNEAGSVKGRAKCSTKYSKDVCSYCLGTAKIQLARCVNSWYGIYESTRCSMDFWQIA
ncbi:hypothetical protein LINGRAHAP2_LOCUS33734 [Linum grandiflorum]